MDLSRKPRRSLRWMYRAPICLYRAGLGRLMGSRFLMLTHRGRRSGLPRYAVLEVVHREPRVWYVAAAYGRHADWFRNVLADPHVQVNFRGTVVDAVAEVVSEEEARRVLEIYERQHPRAARALAKAMGLTDLQAAASQMPMVALRAIDTNPGR